MFRSPILNELYNKYRENKLAHAYLIETNNGEKALDDVKTLIKIINCTSEFKKNCIECNLCNLINKNILPSLKIIEPDGTSIKKGQIEELKNNFSSIPIYSKYNTYIIMNADKLNNSSANSMLKFVEEPTEGILGFFITSNKDTMIDTIKSRCQSLVINYEYEGIKEELGIEDDLYNGYINTIKNYLAKIASNEIIINKSEILNKYSERKDIENILKIILKVYYEKLLKKNNSEFNEEIIKIYDVEEKIDIIIKKLEIISNILHELSYNVSSELILDKFVIEMRGCNGKI